MKNFVYMMLVGSAAAQMTDAEMAQMDAQSAAMNANLTDADKKAMMDAEAAAMASLNAGDAAMGKQDAMDMTGVELPDGMYPCGPAYDCKDKDACATITPMMPDMEQMKKDMPADMEMPDGMMEDMERMMREAIENMPPIPNMCVADYKCGESEKVMGGDFMLGCNGKGMKEERKGGDDRDRKGGDDNDEYGPNDNYIEMGEDGIYARMNDGRGMGFEYSNDDEGIYFQQEMGPMKMEMEMERDDMEVRLDDGQGMRIQVEAGDDGVRLVMMNAKALAASLVTASAMSMSFF